MNYLFILPEENFLEWSKAVGEIETDGTMRVTTPKYLGKHPLAYDQIYIINYEENFGIENAQHIKVKSSADLTSFFASTPRTKALFGLHGRADGPMQEPDWVLAEHPKVKALKLLTSASAEDATRALNLNLFTVARIFLSFGGRVVTPLQFYQWTVDDVDKFYKRGIRYFELHNEPNLYLEGFGTSWKSGREFVQWCLPTISRLKQYFPDIKIGWPGLSPGHDLPNIRASSIKFIDSAGRLDMFDWIGVHCYWVDLAGMNSSFGGNNYKRWVGRGKEILITEYSNPSPHVSFSEKGKQYNLYVEELENVKAAFSFVASASYGFDHEVWRKEDGTLTGILQY